MGKNNAQRGMIPERKNYKLYKAKKQWVTACATVLLTVSATAAMSVDAHAAEKSNDSSVNIAEVEEPATENRSSSSDSRMAVLSNNQQTISASQQNKTPASSDQAVSATPASETTTAATHAESPAEQQSVKKQAAGKANIPAPVIPHAVGTSEIVNGGDAVKWGTLDTSKWTGQNATFNGTSYYQLTGYNGDKAHIIVPN